MPTNNATDTSKPVAISQGGSNASSMTTTDGVIYYDGSKLNTTGVGTAGQILTSNGAGVAPTFQTGGGGSGGLVFLASQTASNSSTLDITSVISNTYSTYQIFYSAVVPVTNTAALLMRVSTNNGSSFIAGNSYAAGINYTAQNSTTFTNLTDNAGASWIPCSGPLSNTANAGVSGVINIYNCSNGAFFACDGQCVFNSSSTGSASFGFFGDGYTDVGGPKGQIGVNALRFFMSTGNISTGTFSIYGVLE